MNSWIAGLVSVVVAGVILLIMFRVGIQAEERSVTATQHRAMRTSHVSLQGFIEHDFQNIGSNFPAYDLDPESAIIEYDTTGSDRSFAELLPEDKNGLSHRGLAIRSFSTFMRKYADRK